MSWLNDSENKNETSSNSYSRKEEYKNTRKIIKQSWAQKKAIKAEKKKKLNEEWAVIKEKKLAYKKEIKEIKQNYKIQKKELKKNCSKDEYQEKLYELKDNTYDAIEKIKKIIYDLEFEHGKKHNTLIWNLKKWAFGVGKEFRRVIWSPPLLTIKYLGIVILIVLILSLIFFGIFQLTNVITGN